MLKDSAPASGARLPRAQAAYLVLAATFSVVLVLTNIIGVKLFVLFPGGRPAWFPGAGLAVGAGLP